jgi:hypothetical protein
MRVARRGLATLLLTVAAFASVEAQAPAPDQARPYLAKWHQPPGPSGCGGRDAYEVTFNFTGFSNGLFAGTYDVACTNAAGNFSTDGGEPAARLSADGIATVVLRNEVMTGQYTLHLEGGELVGSLYVTPINGRFPLKMSKEG